MEENRPTAQQERDLLEAKAQKLLEEKEAESRTRSYSGPVGTAITILLCVWTVFQLYYNTVGVMSAINLRAFHCIFLLTFTFLLYPTYKKERRVRKLPPGPRACWAPASASPPPIFSCSWSSAPS